MPSVEEQRMLLGSFETRNEALREAKNYNSACGLATRVEGDEPNCRVIVESQGASHSAEWEEYISDEYEHESEPGDWAQWRRDFILGKAPESDQLPSGRFHRIFTENLKHSEHFQKRLNSSQYVLLAETFMIGGRPCRKLLDLGRLTAFTLHHLSGASPRVAFLSAMHALAKSDVEIQFHKIVNGPICSPGTGRTLIVMDDQLELDARGVFERTILNEGRVLDFV